MRPLIWKISRITDHIRATSITILLHKVSINFHCKFALQLHLELIVKCQDSDGNSDSSLVGGCYFFCTDSRRTTFGLATISGGLSSQRTATSSIPPQYEVTESNDVTPNEHETVQSVTFQPQDLDIMRLYSIIINNPQPQSNELFTNHPVNPDTSVIGSSAQFGQSNVPMQANLHGSLNVGFPSAAVPQTPYTIARQDLPADLHVGHPAPAGPPLSASQLYNLLNNFPHKLAERYTTGMM